MSIFVQNAPQLVTAATTACVIQLTIDVTARMDTVARNVKMHLASVFYKIIIIIF